MAPAPKMVDQIPIFGNKVSDWHDGVVFDVFRLPGATERTSYSLGHPAPNGPRRYLASFQVWRETGVMARRSLVRLAQRTCWSQHGGSHICSFGEHPDNVQQPEALLRRSQHG